MLGLRRRNTVVPVSEAVPFDGFRAMRKLDLKEIVAIENQAYGFPWSKTIFAGCMRTDYSCRVLLIAGRIGSYGIMSVAADEAHILNLCVRPQFSGRGLAKQMLMHLMEQARSRGANTIFLEVRPSNAAALHIYRGAGFCEVGTRPDYYPDANGREDALVMARTL